MHLVWTDENLRNSFRTRNHDRPAPKLVAFGHDPDPTLKLNVVREVVITRELDFLLDDELADRWFDRIADEEDFDLYQFLAGPGAWLLHSLASYDDGRGAIRASGPRHDRQGDIVESIHRAIAEAYQGATVYLAQGDDILYELNDHDQLLVRYHEGGDRSYETFYIRHFNGILSDCRIYTNPIAPAPGDGPAKPPGA